MLVKCPNCKIQYDDSTFDKCPVCQDGQVINKTEDTETIEQSTNTLKFSHDYSSIAKGLKAFAVIIFILTVIAAIIVGNTIAKVEISSLYDTYTKTNATPIIVTLISGAIAGIFTLILSWVFDGISDILKK